MGTSLEFAIYILRNANILLNNYTNEKYSFHLLFYRSFELSYFYDIKEVFDSSVNFELKQNKFAFIAFKCFICIKEGLNVEFATNNDLIQNMSCHSFLS